MEGLTNSLIILFPIFIFILVTVVAIAFSYRTRKKLRRVLNNLAIKRNGEVTSKFGGLGYPVLRFDYKYNRVEVYSIPGSKNSPPYTYIKVELYSPINEYMHLYKEGFVSRIGKKLGTQDIEVGLDSFDNDIMVKGSDEFFVRNILNYEIQDLVLKIINKYKASIILKKNKLTIIVQTIVYEEFIYEELINTALRITDRIQGR